MGLGLPLCLTCGFHPDTSNLARPGHSESQGVRIVREQTNTGNPKSARRQPRFLQLHPSYQTTARLNFLSTAIHPLKDQYGVLNDRGLPKSKRNLYRFTNPLMRAYVRLRARQEQGAARGFWDPSANTFTTDTPTTTS